MSKHMKVKPCPFCGSSNIKECTDGYMSWAFCEDCGAEGPVQCRDSIGDVSWDSRTHSPAFEAMVEALEACEEAADIWLRMRAIEETRLGKSHGIAVDDDDYAKAWRDLNRRLQDMRERRYAALALARGERS